MELHVGTAIANDTAQLAQAMAIAFDEFLKAGFSREEALELVKTILLSAK